MLWPQFPGRLVALRVGLVLAGLQGLLEAAETLAGVLGAVLGSGFVCSLRGLLSLLLRKVDLVLLEDLVELLGLQQIDVLEALYYQITD